MGWHLNEDLLLIDLLRSKKDSFERPQNADLQNLEIAYEIGLMRQKNGQALKNF